MVRKLTLFTRSQITFPPDLRNLPLGALRRAQELLKLAVAESESESDTSLDEDSTEVPILKRKGKERVEWSTKPLADGGRRNKHA